jgi:hypothetical protein
MGPQAEKVLSIATRVRTPLAVSGLVLAILYLLYHQVLSLNIFQNVGANPTFLIINKVLDRLFWLAVLAMVLGVGSYLIAIIIGRRERRASDVALLNASLNPQDSPYVQTIDNGTKVIKRARGSKKGEPQ